MKTTLYAFMAFLLITTGVFSQRKKKITTPVITEELYESMEYRNIGPFRGGRSTTVSGVPNDIFAYYMGATGGGVMKTTDGGNSWKTTGFHQWTRQRGTARLDLPMLSARPQPRMGAPSWRAKRRFWSGGCHATTAPAAHAQLRQPGRTQSRCSRSWRP